MINRKTTPLLANVLDRVSRPQQPFLLPIRAFDNKYKSLFLQSLEQKPTFTCGLQSRGLGTLALVPFDTKPTSEEGSFSGKEESLSSPLPISKKSKKSHNWDTKPPAPTTETKEPPVDGTKSGSATMNQDPNYHGLNGGWSGGLNPSGPSFDTHPAGGQAYQQPQNQPDSVPKYRHPNAQRGPNSSPVNSQGSHNKKKNKRNRKFQGEGGGGGGEYLTPRQRRKAARGADPNLPQAGMGPNQPLSPEMHPPPPSDNSLPPKPPPTLPQDDNAPPLPQQRTHQASAPSRESGGVPEPTEGYIARASLPPTPSSSPHPLLLVIDLNGTLLHRPSSRRSADYIRRQHTDKFLAYCIDTFSVVIWSSARPENVKLMCENLLTDEQKAKVLAMWGRDKFGLTAADYQRKVQVYKRLGTVWGDRGINPHGQWHQGNTVLIDDSVEKARAEPYNAVTLPEFVGGVEGPGEERVLPAVHEYLNELAMTEDVSRYIRERPFRMDGM
ncbi:HAD-like domain-containing protein [Cercophora samala]|uniref:Mitochondrial import inner membrane translocase subunit TIM50 n=1 Tax=Cercophora samala TaxID=330535 RepID=A0AA39ZMT4_9PEZI|nr:HAD-like domain-containing protein [Cercophora samala]